MNVTARRLRSMGWIATLVLCAALVMILAFRVNALRSQVHQSSLKIIALKQETMYLETEFETRASQQTLKTWNDVEFGYAAPVAAQYLDNERQLAAYSKPAEPGAPAPIRVASADPGAETGDGTATFYPAMVSPLSGKPVATMTDAVLNIGQNRAGASADTTGSATDSATDPARDSAIGAHAAKTGTAAARRHGHNAATLAAAGMTGLAGLRDRLGTVRHAGPAATGNARHTQPQVHRMASKADGPARGRTATPLKRKSPGDKLVADVLARHVARAKDHLASAVLVHGRVADAHHRAPARSSPVKLALKDAKAVK